RSSSCSSSPPSTCRSRSCRAGSTASRPSTRSPACSRPGAASSPASRRRSVSPTAPGSRSCSSSPSGLSAACAAQNAPVEPLGRSRRKPAARGVVATGSPHCSPRGLRPGTGLRGSHRPVPETLVRPWPYANRPSGPSLEVVGNIVSEANPRDSVSSDRPVSDADKAVYFNAVPLFVLACAYLLVAAALTPTLWRERRRVTVTDVALASVFPAVAIPAAIFGAVVLHDKSPVGGHVWPPFAATLIALVPAIVFLRRWSEPAVVLMSGPRAREAEQL